MKFTDLAPDLRADFDPAEPRDEGGKWTGGGDDIEDKLANADEVTETPATYAREGGAGYLAPSGSMYDIGGRAHHEVREALGLGDISGDGYGRIYMEPGGMLGVDFDVPLTSAQCDYLIEAADHGKFDRFVVEGATDGGMIEPPGGLTGKDVRRFLAEHGHGKDRSARADAFDPAEPRDESGKWTEGGGAAPKEHTASNAEWKNIKIAVHSPPAKPGDKPFDLEWPTRAVVNPSLGQAKMMLKGSNWNAVSMARDKAGNWVMWDAPKAMHEGSKAALAAVGHPDLNTMLEIKDEETLAGLPQNWFAMEESPEEKATRQKEQAERTAYAEKYEREEREKKAALAHTLATITADPKFKKWFKKSKVVDKDGKPLRAFHGTTLVFDKFNTALNKPGARKPGSAYSGELGAWFAAPSLHTGNYDEGGAESVASQFAGENFEFKEGEEHDPGANIMPVFLSIQKPMEFSEFEELLEVRDEEYGGNAAKMRKALIKQGYDGVVVRNSMTDGNVDRDDWVAFYPEQIKSAMGAKNWDPKSGVITDSQPATPKVALALKLLDGISEYIRADWDESQHPRGQPENKGEFAKGPGGGGFVQPAQTGEGVEFVSPNIKEGTKLRDARTGLKGARHKFLTGVAAEVDKALGILDSKTKPVIGIWTDGAENSTMTTIENPTWDTLVRSASMKGWLAKQKQVLIFKAGDTDPSHGDDAALASFNAKGKPAEISQYLSEHGLQYHTLEPISGNEFAVHVYGADKETGHAVAEAGEHYGSEVTVRRGRGAFLGTHKEDGSDAEQRADARDVYSRLLDQSGDEGSKAIWAGLRDRYGKQADEVVSDQTETPHFKQWFGQSKIVDEDGQPRVLYHGTLGNFESFDKQRANVESNWGAGFYFTNDPDDLSHNYAGHGPDITNKIENLADEIENEDDFEGDHETAKREAEKRIEVAHEGAAIPVFLKMEQPFKIGGKDETFLDYSSNYNEETEDYGEPHGKAQELIDAIREIGKGEDYYDNEGVENLVNDLSQHAMENEGIQASKLELIASGASNYAYVSDTNGKLVASDILRKALHKVGFDGIIDTRVSQKFPGMKGMKPTTTHYIVFDPHQIKSAIGNHGDFSPKSTAITDSQPLARADGFNPNEARIPKGQPGAGQWTSGGGGLGFTKGTETNNYTVWHNGPNAHLRIMADGKWRYAVNSVVKAKGDDQESLNQWLNDNKDMLVEQQEKKTPAQHMIADLEKIGFKSDEVHGYFQWFKKGPHTFTVDEKTGDWTWNHSNGSAEHGAGEKSMLYFAAGMFEGIDERLAELQEAELKEVALNPNTVGNSAGMGFKLALDQPDDGTTWWVHQPDDFQLNISKDGSWSYKNPDGSLTIAIGPNAKSLQAFLQSNKQLAPAGAPVVDAINAMDFVGTDTGRPEWQNFQKGDDKIGVNTKTGLWVYVDPVTGEAHKGTGDKELLTKLATVGRFEEKAADLLDTRYPPPKPTVEWKPNPLATSVGGDEWNKATAVRLENEFMAEAPAIDALANTLWKDPTPPEGVTEAEALAVQLDPGNQGAQSWDELSDEAKEKVENKWVDNNKDDFINSEIESWNDSGQPLEEAKKNLAEGDDDDWMDDAIDSVFDTYEEAEKPIPYTKEQIKAAMKVEFKGSKYDDGKGDPDIDIAFDKLKYLPGTEPEAADPDQMAIPGIGQPGPPPGVKVEEHLTEEMQDDLMSEIKDAFNNQAEKDASNADAPDYINDQADEQAHEYFQQLDDSEMWKHAEDWLDDEDKGVVAPEKPVVEGNTTEPLDHPPRVFDPLNRTKGANYQRTQAISRALSIARGANLLVKRKLVIPGADLMKVQDELVGQYDQMASTSPNLIEDMKSLLSKGEWDFTDEDRAKKAFPMLFVGRTLLRLAVKAKREAIKSGTEETTGVTADSTDLAARLTAAVSPIWNPDDKKLYVSWVKAPDQLISGLNKNETHWVEQNQAEITGRMRDAFEDVARNRRTDNDPAMISDNVRKIDDNIWQDWVGSSTSFGGKLIQIAAADELGGLARIPERPNYMKHYVGYDEATLMDGYNKYFLDDGGKVKVATMARRIENGLDSAARDMLRNDAKAYEAMITDQTVNKWSQRDLAVKLAEKAVVAPHSAERPDELVVQYKGFDGLSDMQKKFARGAWKEISDYVTSEAQAAKKRTNELRENDATNLAKAKTMGYDPEAPLDPKDVSETIRGNRYVIEDPILRYLDNDPEWQAFIKSGKATAAGTDNYTIVKTLTDRQHLDFATEGGKVVPKFTLGNFYADKPEARALLEKALPAFEASLTAGVASQEKAIRKEREDKAVAEFNQQAERGWESKQWLIDKANADYPEIGGYDGIKALTRAKWETSQWLLAKAGIHELNLFRGISDDDVNTDKITKVTDSKGNVKLPYYGMKRNGAASTSTASSVANHWKSDHNRIVLRLHVPRTAVISLPSYGKNVHSEREVVVTGTAWKDWDAYKRAAPEFEDVPIEHHAAPPVDPSIKEAA